MLSIDFHFCKRTVKHYMEPVEVLKIVLRAVHHIGKTRKAVCRNDSSADRIVFAVDLASIIILVPSSSPYAFRLKMDAVTVVVYPEDASVAAKITVLVLNAPVTTAPVTTYYTTYVPTYFYYEPGYYYIDGVYYYSDGVTLYVIDEDYDPDFVLADGSRVYDLSDTVTEDREPDWIELDGSRVYDLNNYEEDFEPDWIELDGSRVYDLNDYEDIELYDTRYYDMRDIADEDFEADYVLADGSRVYDLNNYEFEPDYVIINGVRVYSDGRIG